MNAEVVELVYEVHVTARDRYETRADGTSFSRFLRQVALDELPPPQAVGLLRLVADSIERASALVTTAEGIAVGDKPNPSSPVGDTGKDGEPNG
jgi:hypothetical protein